MRTQTQKPDPFRVKVVQDVNNPITAELLASSIKTIADAVKDFDSVGLTERAVVLLIADASGVNRGTVRAVIEGMRNLKSLYLKEDK